MEKLEPIFNLHLFGYNLEVTINIFIQWVIILLVTVAALFLTRNLKKIPGKRQSAVELFVEFIRNTVKDTMGEEYMTFVPYVGTLGIFLIAMNFTGLFGFEPPTTDYSVALGMGLTTFIIIQSTVIKKHGILNYFFGYAKPFAILTPINILERVILPVSLSLRLFGNMTAAAVIMKLVYDALRSINWFAQLGVPVFLHGYFDIFDGGVQMVVFTMLTMINIKVINEH